MFIQPTIDKLHALKLTGMADAVRKQLEDPGASQLSFEERLGLIIDHHWSWKENQALQRRLTNSKLRRDACIEDIDWQHVRGLDRGLVRSLATSDWVRKHHQLLLTGPTGVGKSFLASAFAQRACRDGFTAFYTRAAQLFRSLEVARADGSFGSLLHRLGQVDVLVVDDFAMAPLADQERRDFLEICEERYDLRSTILTSQVPVTKWHAQVGDPTLADSILDRLVHNAYRIDLTGGSIRKIKNRKPEGTEGTDKP
jgi:DNA replication protein DnaC